MEDNMSHEGNDRIIDKAIDEMVKGVECPENHIDTYTYDSPEHGLMLMCNVCEDGYSISFKEVK
jgi:hypothetical protein